MLAIVPQNSGHKKLLPNILPCKVNYTGTVDASKRHWKVESDESNQKSAYLRGRKLIGRDVKMPEGYHGL